VEEAQKTRGGTEMFKRFEDLDVWKTGRFVVNKVYEITAKGEFFKDFVLKDQMRGAAISIISNIGEGFERDGDSEHKQFLSYAKGSAGEVRSQLYVALDREYITREEFDETYDLPVRESRMLSGFIQYIKNSGVGGRKYK